MQRRVAANPNDSESEMEKEISPTHEEAAKSFERNDSTTKKEEQKKEASKRPLSDSSNTPPSIQPQKKKQTLQLKKTSVNCLNPTQKLTAVAAQKIKIRVVSASGSETSVSSSTPASAIIYDAYTSIIKLHTDLCCYELIQECTGRYFVCACERQYYKCKCDWKTIGREKGAYKCDNCRGIVANCVSCGSFQVKKKGKTFQCESCHCQLTKELHRSTTF